SIPRLPFLGRVAGDRLRLAPALGRDPRRLDATGDHVVTHRVRATLREPLVVRLRSDRVGVPLHERTELRMLLHGIDHLLVDDPLSLGLQRRLVEVEVGVRGELHLRPGRRRRRGWWRWWRLRDLTEVVAEEIADDPTEQRSAGAGTRPRGGVVGPLTAAGPRRTAPDERAHDGGARLARALVLARDRAADDGERRQRDGDELQAMLHADTLLPAHAPHHIRPPARRGPLPRRQQVRK